MNITKFGAFVNILPGRDGLLHISKIGGGKRIDKVEDVLALGDSVQVVVREIDDRGKVSLDMADGGSGGGGDSGDSTPSDNGTAGDGGGDKSNRSDDRKDRGDRNRDRGDRNRNRDRDRNRDGWRQRPRTSQAARSCPSRTNSKLASRASAIARKGSGAPGPFFASGCGPGRCWVRTDVLTRGQPRPRRRSDRNHPGPGRAVV